MQKLRLQWIRWQNISQILTDVVGKRRLITLNNYLIDVQYRSSRCENYVLSTHYFIFTSLSLSYSYLGRYIHNFLLNIFHLMIYHQNILFVTFLYWIHFCMIFGNLLDNKTFMIIVFLPNQWHIEKITKYRNINCKTNIVICLWNDANL